MALAPKSNAAYKAVDAAMADVERRGNEPPPLHLRDANYRGAKDMGHGVGYKYPHAYGGWVEQQYLPDALLGSTYFAAQRGVELELARRLDGLKRRSDAPSPGGAVDGERTTHDGLKES
jgi:putative ATPase